MGMYTGIRCKVIIKPEFRDEMRFLHEEVGYEWLESNVDFMREYGSYSRANFIPRGCLSYMPDSWDDVPIKENGKRDWINAKATDGFGRDFNKKTGLWSFQCSLKNYDSTIDYFFDHVLNKIAQEIVHLEYYYEEWSRSKFYDLIDGKIVESEREGELYG